MLWRRERRGRRKIKEKKGPWCEKEVVDRKNKKKKMEEKNGKLDILSTAK